MNRYKPEYMGKIMPADDQSKLTDFVTNKYEAFSKVYEMCRDQSDKINTVSNVDTESSSLSVKVSTDSETLGLIKSKGESDSSVSVSGDVITVKGNED